MKKQKTNEVYGIALYSKRYSFFNVNNPKFKVTKSFLKFSPII